MIRVQVNNSGAWKDVVAVPEAQLDAVKDAVVVLGRAQGSRVQFRLVNTVLPACGQVIGYCHAPDFSWRGLP